MARVITLIREHLEAAVSLRSLPPPTTMIKSQWSLEFERLMRNRLLMGGFRYETFEEKKKEGEYEYAAEASRRLLLYFDTLNTEFLVDAANYCLLEFEFGNPKRHLDPTDDSDHHSRKVK